MLDGVSPALVPMVALQLTLAVHRSSASRGRDGSPRLAPRADTVAASCLLAVEPALVPLRSPPRYQALLTRIGVPHSANGFSTAVQRRHNRHRNAGARRATDDRALQRLDFDTLALSQIDQQRRAHRSRDAAQRTPDAVDDVRCNRHALRPRDTLDLPARVEKLHAESDRVGPERADRQPCRAGKPGERDTRKMNFSQIGTRPSATASA